MPSFVPVPYVRPMYEQPDTLGQLLQLQGMRRAEAERQRGDRSAQLWGTIGQQIGNTVTQIADASQKAQAQATLTKQDQAFVNLLAKNPNPDPSAVLSIYGPTKRGMDMVQGVKAFNELQTGAVKDARDTAGRIAIGLKASSPEMQAHLWPSLTAAAVKGGLVSKPEDLPAQPTPEFLDAVIGWATGKEPTKGESFTLGPGQQRFGPDGKPIASVPATPPKVTPPNAGSFEDYTVRYAKAHKKAVEDLTPADIEDARKRYNQADDKATGFAAGDVTPLTPRGLDMAALMYRKTGVMPALGMGDKTTRQRLINRAAELTPEDMARIETGVGDIAANKADYRANADTLAQLTKQRAAIGAFEQTAQKNIDLFLNTAAKVVDTGSPLANALARSVTGNMLGSPDQAAYNAARQVAINEIAKITSNPTLAGTLSDSARKEVEAFNPDGATLKQTVAVLRLLKQDMTNRTKSLDDAIANVRQHISGQTTAPTSGITVSVPNGKTYSFPTQADADAFKAKAGIK